MTHHTAQADKRTHNGGKLAIAALWGTALAAARGPSSARSVHLGETRDNEICWFSWKLSLGRGQGGHVPFRGVVHPHDHFAYDAHLF